MDKGGKRFWCHGKSLGQLAKSDLNYIMSMTNYWFKDNHNFELEKIGMF